MVVSKNSKFIWMLFYMDEICDMSCCLGLSLLGQRPHKQQKVALASAFKRVPPDVTSARTVTFAPNLASLFFLNIHTTYLHLPLSLSRFAFIKNLGFILSNTIRDFYSEKTFLLQIKTLSLHVCIAFLYSACLLITLGVTVLALPQSSNFIHQS